MQNEYQCSQSDARTDWRIFAEELAAGAVAPPSDLLKTVAIAAGGLPKGVSPSKSLAASAALLIASGVVNE